MTQCDLFAGPDLSPPDVSRLSTQLERVRAALADGRWWTLHELVTRVGGISEAGVSARLRDLRKPQHGGCEVVRERVPGARGLWRYRLTRSERP